MALAQWRAADGGLHALDGVHSLEQQMLGESCPTADLLTRVELGQTFEHLLADQLPLEALDGPDGLLARYRLTYKLVPSAVAEVEHTRDTEEFLALCMGTAPDGHLLWEALRAAPTVMRVTVDPAHLAAVQRAQIQFVDWVREVYGAPGVDYAPTWVPEALDHRGGLVTAPLMGAPMEFTVHPGIRGEIDAYSLDATGPVARVPEMATHWCHMMPGHLRVRCMPNARFWDFEDEAQDWGAIEAEPRDLARLVFLETVLTQGNDWFLVPLTLPVGSACRVRSLRVRDVFGLTVDVPRAETMATAPPRRWRMFGHTSGDAEDSGWRVLLPESERAMVSAPPTEEVRFLRDEMANLVWSVERTHADAFGRPVTARHALAIRAADESAVASELAVSRPEGAPKLSYQLQTEVPSYWIPWIAVRVSTAEGDVMIELARAGATDVPLRTRILRPSIAGVWRMPEYVVPRSGVRVVRGAVRVREPDGRSHLWVRRHRGPGRGEGESGLQYDQARDT